MNHNIKLTQKQAELIDKGVQIDLTYYGLPMYAVAQEWGEYETPNGTKFELNFYAPWKGILGVSFEK